MILQRHIVRCVMDSYPGRTSFRHAERLILDAVEYGPSESSVLPPRLKCYKLLSECHFLYVVCEKGEVVKARVLLRTELQKLFKH